MVVDKPFLEVFCFEQGLFDSLFTPDLSPSVYRMA